MRWAGPLRPTAPPSGRGTPCESRRPTFSPLASGATGSHTFLRMHFSNIGSWDRTLRILLGSAILALGWLETVPGIWSAACKLFGWLPIITGALGWSPIYAVFGISTRRPGGTRTRRT